MSSTNYVERLMAQRVVRDVIAAGHHVSINDGEGDVIVASRDEAAILAVMFSTDEDQLYVDFDPTTRISLGWVRFIYGNDGWDVVNDYTTNLGPMMKGANALSDEIEAAKAVTLVALVDPPRFLSQETPVVIVSGEGDKFEETIHTTWGEFAADNPEEVREVQPVLLRGETFRGGGGAQPIYTVRVIQAQPAAGGA